MRPRSACEAKLPQRPGIGVRWSTGSAPRRVGIAADTAPTAALPKAKTLVDVEALPPWTIAKPATHSHHHAPLHAVAAQGASAGAAPKAASKAVPATPALVAPLGTKHKL